MADSEPLYPHQVSINMDPPSSPSSPSITKAAVTDLVYFIAPTTELAIRIDPAGGRLVKRSSGRSLIQHLNVSPDHRAGYVRDFFTTVVNSRWYFIILFFSALYLVSWLLFGCVWLGMNRAYTVGNGTCVQNIDSFSAAFLFSLETQTTIGYGYKYVTSTCGAGAFVLIVQSIVGLLIDSFLLGLIFTKLSRPRKRRRTIMFSKVAVIRQEGSEGQRVLEFRIADVRRSQVVEAHVRLQLYWYRPVDSANRHYQLQHFDLDVGYDTGRDRLFLLTPISVYHHITESSPLHGVTPESLSGSYLELVVVLEGIVEVTGLTLQALWSYTGSEILFGREFVNMVSWRKGRWQVNYSKLSSTVSRQDSKEGSDGGGSNNDE